MKLVIDTNVILDVFAKRYPFYEQSRKILKLCKDGTLQGFVTASSITDIFYLVHKSTHSTEAAYNCLGNLFDIVKILPVTNDNVISAYNVKAHDFEDCLIAVCAKSNGCDYIVTRNKSDFKDFDILAVSPEEIELLLL